MSLDTTSARAAIDLPEMTRRAGATSPRRLCAVGILCCIGMLVVSSLFASPVRRLCYRPTEYNTMVRPETQSSPAHTAKRPAHKVNGRLVQDNC